MTVTNQERKDSWLPEQDTILADTILNYIRSGRTQLEAFETASNVLNRTPAACGFRWNSEVRKRYKEEIAQVKKARIASRETSKKSITISTPMIEDNSLGLLSDNDPLDVIVDHIRNYRITVDNMKRQIKSLSQQINQMNKQLEISNQRIAELENENEQLKNANPHAVLSEDAQTLIKILQRARELGAINSDFEPSVAFKMEANGNLEQIG